MVVSFRRNMFMNTTQHITPTYKGWWVALRQCQFMNAIRVAMAMPGASYWVDLSRYAGRYVKATYRNGEKELIKIMYSRFDEGRFIVSFNAQEKAKQRGDDETLQSLRREGTEWIGNIYERDGRVNNGSSDLPHDSEEYCHDIVRIDM